MSDGESKEIMMGDVFAALDAGTMVIASIQGGCDREIYAATADGSPAYVLKFRDTATTVPITRDGPRFYVRLPEPPEPVREEWPLAPVAGGCVRYRRPGGRPWDAAQVMAGFEDRRFVRWLWDGMADDARPWDAVDIGGMTYNAAHLWAHWMVFGPHWEQHLARAALMEGVEP